MMNPFDPRWYEPPAPKGPHDSDQFSMAEVVVIAGIAVVGLSLALLLAWPEVQYPRCPEGEVCGD